MGARDRVAGPGQHRALGAQPLRERVAESLEAPAVAAGEDRAGIADPIAARSTWASAGERIPRAISSTRPRSASPRAEAPGAIPASCRNSAGGSSPASAAAANLAASSTSRPTSGSSAPAAHSGVSIRVSDANRSGDRSAASAAPSPPYEKPTRCAPSPASAIRSPASASKS